MKTLMLLIGFAALAVGALWIGQGLGYVAWPETSFMIDQVQWSYYGAAVAAAGAVLMIWSRRLR